MAHHTLKTWPTYFDAVVNGEKLFEVRRNDRFFQRGDTVTLVRMDADSAGACYDSFRRKADFTIGAVLQGGQFGIEPGYCVFSLLFAPEQPTP